MNIIELAQFYKIVQENQQNILSLKGFRFTENSRVLNLLFGS